MKRSFWLMKSEPPVFSISDLRRAPGKTSGWDGVRNYQARNYLRSMRRGDRAFFYHSNAEPAGIAGIAEIVREAYPDPTQFERASAHFDPKAVKDKPTWFQVDVRFVSAFKNILALEELRRAPELSDMVLFKSGRLSVQPVAEPHWRAIVKRAELL